MPGSDPATFPSRTPFRPPAPPMLTEPLGLVEFLRRLRENPVATWGREHYERPIVAGESVLGRVTVVSDPAAIRHVLVENATSYRKDDLQIRVLAPGLGNGLLTAEGDEWRLQRRTLAPLFSPRHVTGFLEAMAAAAEAMVARWERRGEGARLDIGLDMTRVTLDVLERTIFTHGLARDPDALGAAITRYFEAVGPVDPLDIFGLPAWLPRLGRLRARSTVRFLETVVNELIEARRRLISEGGEAPRDLMTLLLEASDPETGKGLGEYEVKANIITFIGAGHETTANTLTWTLYLLSQDLDARARVEQEVDEVLGEGPITQAGIERLAFTRAVIEEALRLYPPVPFLSRAALEEDRIGRHRIPKGSVVVMPPFVLHRHRTLWDDPDAFIPERFLPEARSRIDRFAYLPFGAGPRVCIGASFALQEALVVLAAIVRRVRLDLPAGHRATPLHRITLRPEEGLRMRLSRRA